MTKKYTLPYPRRMTPEDAHKARVDARVSRWLNDEGNPKSGTLDREQWAELEAKAADNGGAYTYLAGPFAADPARVRSGQYLRRLRRLTARRTMNARSAP